MATLEDLREELKMYKAAERAILCGHQRYSIEGMTFDRADLGLIQKKISELESRVTSIETGSNGFSCVGVVF